MSETVDVEITYLEMTERPARPAGPPPEPVDVVHAPAPPLHYFFYLYRAVGAAHDWTDLFSAPEERVARFVQDPAVELHVLFRRGAPAGFFQLDFRKPSLCDLSYFGLTPDAIGKGLGKWLLAAAIEMAWRREIERLTVNTCTLDHPAALGVYHRAGFRTYKRESRKRPAT